METYITDDFLLSNETARELYHSYAKNLPIIDYHNHLNPYQILKDKMFSNITDLWLSEDHYKWRALRSSGLTETYITGDKSPYEKFLAWAHTVPKMIGNPLYHWTHLELLRYFDVTKLLNEDTAWDIWVEINEKLTDKSYSTRGLLKRMNVEFVGTTDDPVDDLESHKQLVKSDFSITVSPSFRPDNGLAIESMSFPSWIEKLEATTNIDIENYSHFIDALSRRIDYFDELGCRSSDHGINEMFFEESTESEVNEIFLKRINDDVLTKEEVEKFKTYTLIQLGNLYAEKDWVMQLHINPLRNNSTRMYEKLGPDTGFDSIGDQLLANKLSNLLDEMDRNNRLPKTILYSLNSRDYEVLASLAGSFHSEGIPGKIQLGTAWWFQDTIDGMEKQMKTLANIGLIYNFVGMLTDSRSFLSFTRHEYFRRVLCNIFGTWVEDGKAPKDMELLGEYIENISYENAKKYFNLN